MTLLCYINCRNGMRIFLPLEASQRVNRHHHTGCCQHHQMAGISSSRSHMDIWVSGGYSRSVIQDRSPFKACSSMTLEGQRHKHTHIIKIANDWKSLQGHGLAPRSASRAWLIKLAQPDRILVL